MVGGISIPLQLGDCPGDSAFTALSARGARIFWRWHGPGAKLNRLPMQNRFSAAMRDVLLLTPYLHPPRKGGGVGKGRPTYRFNPYLGAYAYQGEVKILWAQAGERPTPISCVEEDTGGGNGYRCLPAAFLSLLRLHCIHPIPVRRRRRRGEGLAALDVQPTRRVARHGLQDFL